MFKLRRRLNDIKAALKIFYICLHYNELGVILYPSYVPCFVSNLNGHKRFSHQI